MAVRRWRPARRMGAAIHVDRAEGVRPADVENIDLLLVRQLDELDAVWRLELAGDARRLAARVRLELVDLAIGEQRTRPWLDRQLIDGFDGRASDARTGQPDTLVSWRRALQEHSA